MRLTTFFLIGCLAAAAQPLRQQDPFDAAIQAVYQADTSGRPLDVVAQRDRARGLLQSVPLDAPQFANRVQQVFQLYQNAGLMAKARSILEEQLTRALPLGSSHPTRLILMSQLANYWEQDGNLLKAVDYWEQIASVSPQQVLTQVAGGRSYSGYRLDSYGRLASLYQKLGKPEAVTSTLERARQALSADPASLARLYEQQSRFAEAAAIYRRLAEESASPGMQANSWQSAASIAANQGNYPEAIEAMQRAIAASQALERGSNADQSMWMQQTMAGYLRRAGQVEQADGIQQQLMQQARGGPQEQQALVRYGQYLIESQRGDVAEQVVKQYLNDHPNLEQWRRLELLYLLSNAANLRHDTKAQQEYQAAIRAAQPPPQEPSAGDLLIAGEMQKAQEAADHRNWDEAFALAMHAIDNAAVARDGAQIDWRVTQLAGALINNKQTAKADQLYQRLLSIAQAESAANVRRLVRVTRDYANYLISQGGAADVSGAIEQFRRVLVDANGPGSGSLTDLSRLSIQYRTSLQQWPQAMQLARELLDTEQTLSGNTSEPYLNDLELAARTFEMADDYNAALPLRRQAIAVVDLVAPMNTWRRAVLRSDAALTLAHLGQFEDAELLGQQAVTLMDTSKEMPRPSLISRLEDIHRMKAASVKPR